MSKMVKYSDYKKLQNLVKKLEKDKIILAECLCDVRSELTSRTTNKDWCIDEICIALDKITTIEVVE